MRTITAVGILIGCTATGCSGRTEDTDATQTTSSATAALSAKCSGPRGAADPIRTAADLSSRLVGRWYLCPGFGKKEQEPLAAEDAIEFSEDGRWWWLEPGSDGWQHKAGVENGGTWDRNGARDDQPNLVYVRGWNQSTYWLFLGFETSPRRALGTYYSSNPIHMVPLD
jgi:hypothetical protein